MSPDINNKKILLLAVDCELTNILYNSLRKDFNVFEVIFEKPVPKKEIIHRRIKRLGIFRVFGQMLFQAMIVPFLKIKSKKRIRRILSENDLSTSPVDASKIKRINSVHDPSLVEQINSLNPDIIVINGTRILPRTLIEGVRAKIFNIHAGITPMYRGVHGAYWALVGGDAPNCGVTVHFVDQGIDTGGIIEQCTIEPGKEDNFYTYPYLQFDAGVTLLKKVLKKYLSGESLPLEKSVGTPSALWSHPGIFEYLYYRIFKGIK